MRGVRGEGACSVLPTIHSEGRKTEGPRTAAPSTAQGAAGAELGAGSPPDHPRLPAAGEAAGGGSPSRDPPQLSNSNPDCEATAPAPPPDRPERDGEGALPRAAPRRAASSAPTPVRGAGRQGRGKSEGLG